MGQYKNIFQSLIIVFFMGILYWFSGNSKEECIFYLTVSYAESEECMSLWEINGGEIHAYVTHSNGYATFLLKGEDIDWIDSAAISFDGDGKEIIVTSLSVLTDTSRIDIYAADILSCFDIVGSEACELQEDGMLHIITKDGICRWNMKDSLCNGINGLLRGR